MKTCERIKFEWGNCENGKSDTSEMKSDRFSYDVVTSDMDRDVSPAYCESPLPPEKTNRGNLKGRESDSIAEQTITFTFF